MRKTHTIRSAPSEGVRDSKSVHLPLKAKITKQQTKHNLFQKQNELQHLQWKRFLQTFTAAHINNDFQSSLLSHQ